MTECNDISPTSSEALLSSADGFTTFRFGGYNIRFRAPYSLERYVDVVKWDDGYLVVLAKYSHNIEPEEEYIDLKYPQGRAPVLCYIALAGYEKISPRWSR